MPKHIFTLSTLALLPLSLCACTTGNERGSIGNGAANNTVKLAIFRGEGEPPPPTPDAATTTSLSRSNWQTKTVLVPMDGLASKPTYARSHIWTDKTARQRGQMPTDLTALELDGDTYWTQVEQSAASPAFALWDATRFVLWDAWVDPPWDEHVYPLRPGYQRAALGSQRAPSAQANDSAEAAR